jgi:protein-S-isoprenylcysteine O-methyltransferase Ste14
LSLVSNAVEQGIFITIFVIWLATIFVVEPIITRNSTRSKARTREDRGSAALIFVSTFVAIVVALQFAGANIFPLPSWLFFVGIGLMTIGIGIREWAVTTLRGFFLFTVGVREGHRIVETGPYKLVRHPSYTGAIFTFLGIGFATQSAVAVLILAVICGLAYGYRIHIEERALVKGLGEEYSRIMGKTKRLIPFVF